MTKSRKNETIKIGGIEISDLGSLSYDRLCQVEIELKEEIDRVKSILRNHAAFPSLEKVEAMKLASRRKTLGKHLLELSHWKGRRRSEEFEAGINARFNYFFVQAAFKVLPALVLEKLRTEALVQLSTEAEKKAFG